MDKQLAPNFTCLTDTGETFQLSDLKGQHVVLYFYPKDDTSGCTAQACDFRDNLSEFKKLDAVVIGISKDSVKKHEKFKAKYDLPFTLLSDESTEVCTMYDVMKEKSMYGKKYMGIERSTFLIDKDGMIQHEWRKVKVSGHVDDVKEKLQSL